MENFNLMNILENEMLLTTEDGNIWLHPDNNYGFTTYPLPEDKTDCILVTKDEYLGLLLHLLMFTEDLKSIKEFEEPIEDNLYQ